MGLHRGRVSSSRQVRTPPRWGHARARLGVGVPGRLLGKGRGGGGGVKLAAPLPKPLRKLEASGLGRGSFLPPGAPINLGAGLRLAARRLLPPVSRSASGLFPSPGSRPCPRSQFCPRCRKRLWEMRRWSWQRGGSGRETGGRAGRAPSPRCPSPPGAVRAGASPFLGAPVSGRPIHDPAAWRGAGGSLGPWAQHSAQLPPRGGTSGATERLDLSRRSQPWPQPGVCQALGFSAGTAASLCVCGGGRAACRRGETYSPTQTSFGDKQPHDPLRLGEVPKRALGTEPHADHKTVRTLKKDTQTESLC